MVTYDFDASKISGDFIRAFKYCRFDERKTFGEARNAAIEASCALNGGTIHDHAEVFAIALKDLCINHRGLWGDDIRAEDNRWFQHFSKGD